MIPDKIEWDPEAKSWIASKDTPDAITAEWDGEKWVKGKNPSGPGSLRRGFATGVESTKGLVADIIPAMVQSAFGYDEAAQKNLQEYRDRMKALEARNLLTRMDYQKVNDLGSAAEFAGEAIGESIPSLITTLAGGVGVGAAAARLGAGRLLTQQVGKKAAELEAKGVAKDAALQQATKEVSQQVGSVAGAFGGSALLNIPESYLNLAEAGNASLGASFAVGALKSTLDALGPLRLLSKTRGPDFSDKVTDLVSARLLKGRPGAAGALGGALETAALEGITEGTQQLLDETAAAILADKSIDWNNIINAALKGGVGSAPVGAAAGAYGARQKAAAAEAATQETQQAEAAAAAEAEAKKQQALEARQKYQQETEAALSLPEDLMLRREFGEIKDSASYEKLANYFANAAKKAKGTQKERLTEEAQRYSALAQTADTEKIVSQLASYYGFNREQEAALLKSATDFTGPGRAQFENFVAETLKDPAVAGRIPGLQNVEFLSVVPPTTTLALPAPTAASFEIPDYGTVTARQADEIISRFQSRPVMEGADTRDRDEKLAELQQLDPNVNPNVVTMDPNERRRIALGIITRKDIKQIEKPTGEPVGTVETETGEKPTDTVPKTETISTVGAAGQLGTRTEMGTFDNLYQRIVANMDNAPEGTLGLNWLLGAAGVSRQNAATPEGQVAADTVKQNAAQIWNQLVADGYVTRRGALGFTAVPADQREAAAASTEVGRLVRLPSLSEALGDAYVSGLTKGKPQLLDINWLTRALGVPVSPTTARTVWTTLQNQGRVAPAGMGKYRATVWPQGETPSPTPAPPAPQPTPPTPQPPAPAPKIVPPQPPAPKPQPKAPTPPQASAQPAQVFENIYNAYLRSVGSKWNKVGIGPILTLDKLLREVQKTSGPNYTMENLGQDLMLIDANPDLRSDSGSMVEFPSSTIAREPKIPRVHVPYRGTTVTFYGIRFSQDPDFQKSEAEQKLTNVTVNPKPESVAAKFGGRVVWRKGDLALVETYSALNGDPIYIAAKNDTHTRVDISKYTGPGFSETEKQELLSARKDVVDWASKVEKENPNGPFQGSQTLVVMGLDSKVAGILAGWKSLLGLQNIRIVVTTPEAGTTLAEDMAGKFRRIGFASRDTDGTFGRSTPLGDNDFHIMVSPNLTRMQTLEVLSHEMGHILEKVALKNASPEVQQAIKQEYEKWLASTQGKSAQDLIESLRPMRIQRLTPAPAGKSASELSPYFRSFGEWFADQVARWATTQKKPVSVVEKFFKKLADKLKTFFVGTRARYAPTKTVSEWLDGLDKIPAPDAIGNEGAPSTPVKVGRVDDQAVTPVGAPQKVAAEAKNMLDRMGRQEAAANKSVSDDYSCG